MRSTMTSLGVPLAETLRFTSPVCLTELFIRRTFRDVHEYFGEFTERALEESSFMIDRLVERS